MKYEFNVQYSDIVSLLELDPDVKKTFRYYEKRKKDSMKNHIVNFFLKENEEVIGYGHLDFEEKLWLGMFVFKKFSGKGYGKIILEKLIEYAKQDIYLSVDKDNIAAINLYLSHNFKIYSQTDNIFYCVRRENV